MRSKKHAVQCVHIRSRSLTILQWAGNVNDGVSAMKKVLTTFRYVIRLGPAYVGGGITNDLGRSRVEGKARWPNGRFFQVGDRTTEEDARAWAVRHGYSVPSAAGE